MIPFKNYIRVLGEKLVAPQLDVEAKLTPYVDGDECTAIELAREIRLEVKLGAWIYVPPFAHRDRREYHNYTSLAKEELAKRINYHLYGELQGDIRGLFPLVHRLQNAPLTGVCTWEERERHITAARDLLEAVYRIDQKLSGALDIDAIQQNQTESNKNVG